MQLPEDFTRQTRQVMGEERFSRLLQAFDEPAPATIRINPLKCYYMPYNFSKRVPWCNTGYYLNDRPQFTFDPLFHAGLYYVQEAASMFVSHVIRSLELRVESLEFATALDLCAAPGGKSTAMRTVLPHGTTLYCNEPVRQRAQVLLENIQKFGHRDCVVTSNYPRDYKKSGLQFDLILADVPCSGEGMFRRDEKTIGEWSLQNVEHCAQLQREIISDIWPCLAPGGILIYSTCTFNTKENEENVRWIQEQFGAELIEVPTEPDWNITGSLLPGFEGSVYRFIPGISQGEGLFLSILRKPGAQELTERPSRREGMGVGSLNVLQEGIPLFTMRGKNEIPSQALALAASLDKKQFPMEPLTWEEAIRYLRGESLTLHDSVPRGFVIVTYRGIPLGFVKNIGQRANNLYPDGWRIRTTHTPNEPPKVLDI